MQRLDERNQRGTLGPVHDKPWRLARLGLGSCPNLEDEKAAERLGPASHDHLDQFGDVLLFTNGQDAGAVRNELVRGLVGHSGPAAMDDQQRLEPVDLDESAARQPAPCAPAGQQTPLHGLDEVLHLIVFVYRSARL